MLANIANPIALDRQKVPKLLAKIPRWLAWQAGQPKPNGKFDKVPVSPATGRNINGNDPANWLTFAEALAAYDAGKCSGIGLALCDEPVGTWNNALCGAHQFLVALDFDHVGGDKLEAVKAVRKSMKGIYSEVSPSGSGIRMLALSRTPPKGGNAGDGREMYAGGRFMTITGVKGSGDIIDATEKLAELQAKWFSGKGSTDTKALPAGLEGARRVSTDAVTLELAGLPPETPEAIARVHAQLAHIDADCAYELWRNVVWSLQSTGWECAEDVARDWSRTADSRFDENAFLQLVKSFDPSRGITLGTLDHHAREGGWRPLVAVPKANPILGSPSQHKRLLTATQLNALPPQTWKIRGLLPSHGLASIYGPSGSGKTFLALDVACTIAAGQPLWFGLKVKGGPVAYVALEGEGGIRQRLAAWEHHHGQPVTDSVRFVLGNYTLLDPQDSTLLAAEIIETLGTGAVVFIDTLNQAAPGADENTSSDMGRIITNAKALAAAIDGIVVLVHHAGKDAARGMRGHSSLFAAMDAVIEVKNTVNGRTWNLAKSKDSVSGVAHGFEFVHHVVGQDEDGLDITSCAIRPMLQLSPTRKPLSGKNQIAALAALTRIAPAHPNGVPAKLAQQTVANILVGQASRKNAKAKQLIEALTDSGHLKQENEGVFLSPP